MKPDESVRMSGIFDLIIKSPSATLHAYHHYLDESRRIPIHKVCSAYLAFQSKLAHIGLFTSLIPDQLGLESRCALLQADCPGRQAQLKRQLFH